MTIYHPAVGSVCRALHRAAHAIREPPREILARGRTPGVEGEPIGPVGDGFGELLRRILPRLAGDVSPLRAFSRVNPVGTPIADLHSAPLVRIDAPLPVPALAHDLPPFLQQLGRLYLQGLRQLADRSRMRPLSA